MLVKIKYPILVYCLLVFVFSGCGKYEDGPTISFRTSDKRIIKLWKFTHRTLNGTDITSDYLNDTVYFRNYGLYTYYSISNGDASGLWSYINHKRGINILSSGSIAYDSGGYSVEKYYSNNITFTIKKLKNNELWLDGDEVTHDSIFWAGNHSINNNTRTINWKLVPVE